MFFIPIQLKIQCNVKMGPPPPPGGLPAKRGDDPGMSSEDDGLPRSPPEMSLLHDIGPGTTIKASTACVPRVHRTHHGGQPGLGGPRARPVVGGRARCRGGLPAQVAGAHSWHLFSLFEQKCPSPEAIGSGSRASRWERSDPVDSTSSFLSSGPGGTPLSRSLLADTGLEGEGSGQHE